MKKIYFLLLTILMTSVSFGQGTETFDNFAETGSSYANGTFTGNDGSTWTYVQSRGDQSITGKSLMLGRNRTPQAELTSGVITGGIGTISFNYQRAFSTAVNLNILVNDVVVGNVTSSDANVYNSGSITVNEPNNAVIKFISVNNSDGQVTIDDITWTGFSTACGVALNAATYTCNTNTGGDNNDSVTIEIPYTGSDAAITSVTTTSTGTIGGDNPATVANGIITITGLSEGDAWDVALVGGDCGAISTSGTVDAALCDPVPTTCFDISNGAETFEIVTVVPNTAGDQWELNAGTYSLNAYCGSGCAEAIEAWMVFGPLDMTGVTDLALAFDATEAFGVTDLNIKYTSNYTGCPSSTTWTTAQTITDAGTYSIDLSAATGTDVFVSIEYNDDGADGYSGWDLSNVALNAFGACPTLGTRPTSNCAVCDVILQTETYTCATNTAGDNNDGVTVEIPYTGTDATITSLSTTSTGTIAGDDPATVADGVITITGLNEGDAWDLTINGGDCDATTVSGTIAASNCDPVFLVINEINADPDATAGDANGDGVVDTSDDEFIEIYNTGVTPIDLSDYTIADGASDRHVFPTGTILAPNSFIVVFGGGIPTGIQSTAQVASTGGLGLNNGGDTITITNNNGVDVLVEVYTAAGNNQSIGRSPDFTGAFVDHSTISANPVLFSPGVNNDGTLSVDTFNNANFSIYPNPTNTGFVNITTTSNEAITVTVFDILGKQVLSQNVNNNTLNVSSLNTGVYILKLNQNGATMTKKLVVK
ncbi:lamin tail domain-containing protein [Lacinutrix venerupis]|nr:lamin tail domain-containing protein [Lacinutrix venerupis]